jgi:hypothetical protein
MTITCAVCEKPFEGKTSRAKFCGATCRQRASRGTSKPADGEVVRSVRADLRKAKVLDTYEAAVAIAIARQIDGAGPAGISSLSKELRVVMNAAIGPRAVVEQDSDEPEIEDEVQKAREARELIARNAAG